MSSAVDAFGGSFFNWFQDEVLPYMLGTLYIIIMIFGFILNGVLITTIRKKNMLEIRTNQMILELAITDLVACILFIFPAIIVAFWRKWQLSDYVCKFHGTIFTTCYLISFGLLILLAVERVVRAKNFDIHDRFFLRSNGIKYLSVLIWFIAVAIACIPHSGWVKISYDFYQASCIPEFGNNSAYVAIVFTFGIGFCLITYFISYAMIFYARKKQLDGAKNSGGGNLLSLMSKNKNGGESSNNSNSVTKTSSVNPKMGWEGKTGGTTGRANSKFAKLKVRDKMKKAVTKVKVGKMFSSSNKDPDFTLAVTYFITACLMLFLWLPYFIIAFVSISDKNLWGGYRTIGSVIAMSSYCVKPVIYLAHNRSFRKVTTDTLPQKMVEKATKIRDSVNEALDKIEKVMFMSAATKKFRATIKTTIIAKRWLNRARANIRARNAKKAGIHAKESKCRVPMVSLKKINEEPEKRSVVRKHSKANTRAIGTINDSEDVIIDKPKTKKYKGDEYQNPKHVPYRSNGRPAADDAKRKRKRSPRPIRVVPLPVESDDDVFGTGANKPKKVPYTYEKRIDPEPEDDNFNDSDIETMPVRITVLEKSSPTPSALPEKWVNEEVSPVVRHSPVKNKSPVQIPSTMSMREANDKDRQHNPFDKQSEPINTNVPHKRASIVTSLSSMPIIINNSDGLPDVPVELTESKRRRSQFHSLGEYQPSVAENANRRNTVAGPLLKSNHSYSGNLNLMEHYPPNGNDRHASSVPLNDPLDNTFKGENKLPYSDRVDYKNKRNSSGNMPTFRLPFLAEHEDNIPEENRNNLVIDLPSQISKHTNPIPLQNI